MMSWTEDRVARLKALWNSGASATEIAAELGGVTRNAVLGKIHRDGLCGRPKRVAPPSRRAPKERVVCVSRSAASTAAVELPVAPPIDDATITLAQRRSLVGLDDKCCHWPVGDPGQPDFFFCGAAIRNDGDPFCIPHMRRAHALPGDRRRMPDPAKAPSRPTVSRDAWR